MTDLNERELTMKINGGRILITGGAGYIGSHTALQFKELGWEVAIVDNFSRGNRDIVARLALPVFEENIGDSAAMERCLREFRPDAVMHFSAFAYVGESVTEPRQYYENNVEFTVNLLNTMLNNDVGAFIFSSTCATYGVPASTPITEKTPQHPINPYGRSKMFIERILEDYDAAYGLRSIVFRYFNAAGAHSSGLIGERHAPETHLIPVAIHAAVEQKAMAIFGDDYPTPDGTCVRDYIHVADIADAHARGASALLSGSNSDVFNIGNGSGYSVREVIREVEEVTGLTVPFQTHPRRAGDPPALVASSQKLREQLGWQPRYPSLRSMVESAWAWYQIDRENQGHGFN